MIQQGRVLSVEKDYAIVEIIRESACSSCHNKDSCGASVMAGCAKKERVEVKALNSVNAEPGQLVELSSDSAKTLGIAFCVFVLPLILAMLGYYIAGIFLQSSAMRIVSAFGVLIVAFFGLFFGFDRILKGRVNVEITSVISD